MAPEMELGGKLKSKVLSEAVTSHEDLIVCQDSVSKSMPCASNHGDSEFEFETALDAAVGRKMKQSEEDMVVDVTDCSKLGGTEQFVDEEALDSTENSSSFGGTLSDAENGAPLSDGEVDSQVMVGPFCLDRYPDESLVRKKKLTDHWRRFIHPLRWRCQWLELQIQEFQSRSVKYDKLADYEHQKHRAFDKLTSEGCNSKSLPFSGQIQRNNVLKRNRRKKIEQTDDLPSYISNHNLFSHYVQRPSVDNVLAKDQRSNQDDTRSFVDPRSDYKFDLGDGGSYMEQILAKIYKLKSQVHELKTRIEKVVNENPSSLTTSGIHSSAATRASKTPPSPSTNEHQSRSQNPGGHNVADASSHREVVASLSADVRQNTTQKPSLCKTQDGNPTTNTPEMLKHEDITNNPPETCLLPMDQSMISPAKVVVVEEGVTSCALPIKETPSSPPLKTYVKRKQRRRGEAVVVALHQKSKT